MAEPAWLVYLGAVTGVAGSVMGWVALRRTDQLKALDLRLELRKAESDLQASIDSLPAFLEHAKKSRTNVAAAMGLFKSGMMKAWSEEHAADVAMLSTLPLPEVQYSAMSHAELEDRLVVVHERARKATSLREKYEASVLDDEKNRDHLRTAAQHKL